MCLRKAGPRRSSVKRVKCGYFSSELLFLEAYQARSTVYGVNMPHSSARLAEEYDKILDLYVSPPAEICGPLLTYSQTFRRRGSTSPTLPPELGPTGSDPLSPFP